MENFCDNIKHYGKSEDITSLASCAVSLNPPMLISTLTRKFYFTPSENRGYRHHITEKHALLSTDIKNIKELVGKQQSNELKPKTSFLKRVSNFFKNGDNRNQKEGDKTDSNEIPTVSPKDRQINVKKVEQTKPSTSGTTASETIVKVSKVRSPSTKLPERPRSRTISTSSVDARNPHQPKNPPQLINPPWKH